MIRHNMWHNRGAFPHLSKNPVQRQHFTRKPLLTRGLFCLPKTSSTARAIIPPRAATSLSDWTPVDGGSQHGTPTHRHCPHRIVHTPCLPSRPYAQVPHDLVRHPTMSELTYIGWGGKTAHVETDLDMGRGSFRNLPQYGIRRAVWDAAFGYISGFKKTAILYYLVTRSLNRRFSIWAMKREGIRFTTDGIAIASSITEKYARD